MDITYRPYIDPELEVLIERINPPRVCIDNDTYPDCTLVKVDSANKHGMLLEMVQVLTDIDLVISKSYISSDGGWFMDVFHVTDQLGNKITDERLIHYIQEGICASRRAAREPTSRTIAGPLGPQHLSTENTALEMTGIDRPGLMSEMSAALSDLGCHVSSAIAWTHNGRAAVILYVEDSFKAGPIMNARRAAEVQAHMEKVIAAHHKDDEQRSIKVTGSACGQTHTERRLHQLLSADKDYESCCSCCGGNNEDDGMYGYARCQKVTRKGCDGTHVRIENCKETGYSIVNIRSRDRPKLLFDTVCTLTDLEYVVSHAAISSKGSMAFQEYYVTHKDGYTVDSEDEKRRVIQCLIAATERRVSHGMRLDVCTRNKTGLLSDVTRVFRENGLSISRAELGVSGEEAIGTFYVKDTSERKVSPKILETMRKEIGGTIVLSNKSSPDYSPRSSTSGDEERQSFSLGNLLWTQLERISSGFKPIRS